MSKTLSITGAAALHGISHKAVRHAIDTGALKAEKLSGPNGQYLLRAKDVEAWVATRPSVPGSTGYFAAMRRLDSLPDVIRQHHAITADLPLADVVIACKCSPDVERDELAWATHLRDVMSGATETSDAIAS
jgi:excisionase family DNA binding protein